MQDILIDAHNYIICGKDAGDVPCAEFRLEPTEGDTRDSERYQAACEHLQSNKPLDNIMLANATVGYTVDHGEGQAKTHRNRIQRIRTLCVKPAFFTMQLIWNR